MIKTKVNGWLSLPRPFMLLSTFNRKILIPQANTKIYPEERYPLFFKSCGFEETFITLHTHHKLYREESIIWRRVRARKHSKSFNNESCKLTLFYLYLIQCLNLGDVCLFFCFFQKAIFFPNLDYLFFYFGMTYL